MIPRSKAGARDSYAGCFLNWVSLCHPTPCLAPSFWLQAVDLWRLMDSSHHRVEGAGLHACRCLCSRHHRGTCLMWALAWPWLHWRLSWKRRVRWTQPNKPQVRRAHFLGSHTGDRPAWKLPCRRSLSAQNVPEAPAVVAAPSAASSLASPFPPAQPSAELGACGAGGAVRTPHDKMTHTRTVTHTDMHEPGKQSFAQCANFELSLKLEIW